MKKFVTIMVLVLGIMFIPTNVDALILKDKKISFNDFTFDEENPLEFPEVYDYRESDDYFYIVTDTAYYKGFYDGTFEETTAANAEPDLAVLKYYKCRVIMIVIF